MTIQLRVQIRREADRLTVEWRQLSDQLNASPNPSTAQIAAEDTAWNALVDYCEAHDLNYTSYDPRS